METKLRGKNNIYSYRILVYGRQELVQQDTCNYRRQKEEPKITQPALVVGVSCMWL